MSDQKLTPYKPTVTCEAFSLQLRDAVEKRMRFINEHRERFVEAFVAETGYLPSEVVMIQKDEGNGTTRIWFERKQKPADLYGKDEP